MVPRTHPPSAPSSRPLTFLQRVLWLGQLPVQQADGDVPARGPTQARVAGLLALQLIKLEVAGLLHHCHGIIVRLFV